MAYRLRGETEFEKGMGLPRLTTAQRTAYTPSAAGYKVYDTDLLAEFTYNGTVWENASASGKVDKAGDTMTGGLIFAAPVFVNDVSLENDGDALVISSEKLTDSFSQVRVGVGSRGIQLKTGRNTDLAEINLSSAGISSLDFGLVDAQGNRIFRYQSGIGGAVEKKFVFDKSVHSPATVIGDIDATLTTKGYVDGAIPDISTLVLKTGDTMTGLLVLSADPSANLGAATKQYVDSKGFVADTGDTMTGDLIVDADVIINRSVDASTAVKFKNGGLEEGSLSGASGTISLSKISAGNFKLFSSLTTVAGPDGVNALQISTGDLTLAHSSGILTMDTGSARIERGNISTGLGSVRAKSTGVDLLFYNNSVTNPLSGVQLTDNSVVINGSDGTTAVTTITATDVLNTLHVPTAFTDTVLLSANPTLDLQAATKQYVDNVGVFNGGTITTNLEVQNAAADAVITIDSTANNPVLLLQKAGVDVFSLEADGTTTTLTHNATSDVTIRLQDTVIRLDATTLVAGDVSATGLNINETTGDARIFLERNGVDVGEIIGATDRLTMGRPGTSLAKIEIFDADMLITDAKLRSNSATIAADVDSVLTTKGYVDGLSQPDYSLVAGSGTAAYTVAFTIAPAVAGKSNLQVFVNGLKQVLGATKAYTITGNVVTFTAGNIPASGADVEFYGFG
jgi:hypothetical protein